MLSCEQRKGEPGLVWDIVHGRLVGCFSEGKGECGL